MALLKVKNTLSQTAEKTFLTHNESAGTGVLRWQNPNAFSSSWAVQVGETGHEQTEVVLLGTAAVAGTAGTLTANTLYEHPADTPLYAIKYNKVIFERSTSGTAGTATPITSGTVTYQPDSEYTVFDDTTGASTYAYRTRFNNSVLAVQTDQSDWFTFAGPSFYSLYKIRERAKGKLWNADYLTDSLVDDWINEWKFEMQNYVIRTNEDYALGTENVAFGTDGLGTITTADFSQVRRVWVTYNGQDKFQSTKFNINNFVPDQVFSSTHPYHAFRGDSTIEVHPSESGGTAELIFYRFGTTLVNDTDELPVPMRPYTKSFVDFVVANAFMKDGKQNEYRDKLAEANIGREQFLKNLSPRDKTGPTTIDIVEPITGEDAFWP